MSHGLQHVFIHLCYSKCYPDKHFLTYWAAFMFSLWLQDIKGYINTSHLCRHDLLITVLAYREVNGNISMCWPISNLWFRILLQKFLNFTYSYSCVVSSIFHFSSYIVILPLGNHWTGRVWPALPCHRGHPRVLQFPDAEPSCGGRTGDWPKWHKQKTH